MAIARSSITIIRCWRWCWDILRPLDCIVLPLLAFHIILLFIALVTFVAVCREAVSSRRPRLNFVTLEPRGIRPMPWIQPDRAIPKGPKGGDKPIQQRIRCDKCDWETKNGYWAYKDAREEAGAFWPTAEEHQGEGEHMWCPRCASRESWRAAQSYRSTDLNIEAVMSAYWRAPNGGAVVPGNTVAKAHEGRVPPKAPPPGLSSSSPSTEQRLAALEADVANLRLKVAGLEERSSGAASSSGLARPGAWSQGWAWSQDWARGRD